MKIIDLLGGSVDENAYLSSDDLVDSDTFVGVECEIEGVNSDALVDETNTFFWSIRSDGSLRDGGFELIFNNPLKGANVIKAMGHFREGMLKLSERGVRPSISDRTSIHVHVDVRDLEPGDLNQLVLLYMLFEKHLFEYVGTHRIKNNYCRPLLGSSFEDVITELLMRSDERSYLHLVENICEKYSALNVKASSYFGSVEFRHHPGTCNSDDILKWINILLSLKKWIKEGGKVVDLLDIPSHQAIQEVFGDYGSIIPDVNGMYTAACLDIKRILDMTILKDRSKKILTTRSRSKKSLIQQFSEKGVA